MRKLFFLVLVAHAVTGMAAPKIKQKVNNGIWRVANTWDLNRVPDNTDTVVIPSGNVVIIDDHQNLGNSKLIVMVYGTLQFSGVGKLTLDANSAVFVQSGGIVDGNGSNAQKLKIGSQQLSGAEIQIAASNNALLLTATSSGYQPVPPGSGFGSFSVLPVTFSNFGIYAVNGAVDIKWTTVNEQNNRHFEIERSHNSTHWTKVATIAATVNAAGVNHYSYRDATALTGTVYYRIKQVDADGRFVYTPQRSLNGSTKPAIKIWSALNKVAIDFPEPVKGLVEVRLVSMSGQVLKEETLKQPVGQIMVDKNDQKGYHVVIVTNLKDVNVVQKVNF